MIRREKRLTKLTIRVILLIAVIGFSSLFANLAPYILAQQNSSITITYSPQTAIANSWIVLNATVIGNNATGIINWMTNGTGVFDSTQTVLISGTSTVFFNDSTPSNETITASYLGDANNLPSKSSFTITIYSPADFNHDGKVNLIDVTTFVISYNNFVRNGQYNPSTDLNSDGNIDLHDLILFLYYYQMFMTSDLTPTLSPISTPTSTPASSSTGNSLPLSCLGDDYLTWSNWNGDPSAWDSQLHWFTTYHCTGARLSFSFADDSGTNKDSTYSWAKMDSVLTKLSSVGVKAVICDFAGSDSHFYGSQAWVNDWTQVASDFKGDSRIAAFEIANEPYTNYLASNANTMHNFNVACFDVISQIRSVDSVRAIMMPIEFNIFTNDINAFYNDLVSTGITGLGNIKYDVLHPYYFQDPHMDGYDNPGDCADGFYHNLLLPQISKFGVTNCWAGETFCWPRGPNGGWNGQINISYADQQTFERRMINYLVDAGVGFQMWCFITSSDKQAQIDALNGSGY